MMARYNISLYCELNLSNMIIPGDFTDACSTLLLYEFLRGFSKANPVGVSRSASVLESLL